MSDMVYTNILLFCCCFVLSLCLFVLFSRKNAPTRSLGPTLLRGIDPATLLANAANKAAKAGAGAGPRVASPSRAGQAAKKGPGGAAAAQAQAAAAAAAAAQAPPIVVPEPAIKLRAYDKWN